MTDDGNLDYTKTRDRLGTNSKSRTPADRSNPSRPGLGSRVGFGDGTGAPAAPQSTPSAVTPFAPDESVDDGSTSFATTRNRVRAFQGQGASASSRFALGEGRPD